MSLRDGVCPSKQSPPKRQRLIHKPIPLNGRLLRCRSQRHPYNKSDSHLAGDCHFLLKPSDIARHPHSQGSPVRSHSIRGFQQRFFCIAFQESLTFTFPFVNEICIAIPFESDKSTPTG